MTRLRNFSLIIAAALALGAAVALLSPGTFLPGWAGASLLFALSGLGLYAAWKWGGGGRQLVTLIALAFLLRVVAGIGLSFAYQTWGYDQPVYKAGYLFPDAMKRDSDAYQIGISSTRLLFNPELTIASDQYGGLGLLSAAVYRYLSPDAHRPFLMLIIGAFFFALGVPFLLQAVRLSWSETVAALAVWIYILYPDGIFFTSSQMREPYMLGLSAVAFWAVLAWGRNYKSALIAGLLSAAGMLLFSTRSALFLLGVLAFLFLLEYVTVRPEKAWKIAGWTGLALGGLFAAAVTWVWFREAAGWDLLLTTLGSGVVQSRLAEIGQFFQIPFLMGLGLAQPVLPAAITETNAIPLAKTIVILRSLGWYLLAPLLLYAAFSLFQLKDRARRTRMTWAVSSVILWACIVSLRAGGDMTDNPRYRVLFLVWMALIAAWAIEWARSRRDAWLARWLAVEGIFLAAFTLWYANRYYHFPYKPPFFLMIALIIVLSALILGGGWLYDRRKQPR